MDLMSKNLQFAGSTLKGYSNCGSAVAFRTMVHDGPDETALEVVPVLARHLVDEIIFRIIALVMAVPLT